MAAFFLFRALYPEQDITNNPFVAFLIEVSPGTNLPVTQCLSILKCHLGKRVGRGQCMLTPTFSSSQAACEEHRPAAERIFILQLLTGQLDPQVLPLTPKLQASNALTDSDALLLHIMRPFPPWLHAYPSIVTTDVNVFGLQVALQTPRNIAACLPLSSRVNFPPAEVLRKRLLPARCVAFSPSDALQAIPLLTPNWRRLLSVQWAPQHCIAAAGQSISRGAELHVVMATA